jgi:isopentenyl diphosphate isomerase/L-lactate dehydrogenase-like FMN-dependent dehydrogenase
MLQQRPRERPVSLGSPLRKSLAMRQSVMPIVIVIQFTLIAVLLISHSSGLSSEESMYATIMAQRKLAREAVAGAAASMVNKDTATGGGIEKEKIKEYHTALKAVHAVAVVAEPAGETRPTKRLAIPGECATWKSVAKDFTKLRLYREHFTSLDSSAFCWRNI